jgi:hypothetical protein
MHDGTPLRARSRRTACAWRYSGHRRSRAPARRKQFDRGINELENARLDEDDLKNAVDDDGVRAAQVFVHVQGGIREANRAPSNGGECLDRIENSVLGAFAQTRRGIQYSCRTDQLVRQRSG